MKEALDKGLAARCCCTPVARRQERAATLVELLVAFALTAVLACLIVAAVRHVQGLAEASGKTSELRQIGAALFQFAADHGGVLPAAGNVVPYGGKDPGSGRPAWQEQLDAYIGGDRSLFGFPNQPRTGSTVTGSGYFLGTRAAYIEQIESRNEGPVPPVRLSRIVQPSAYIVAGECASHEFAAEDADRDNYSQEPAFGFDGASTVPVHVLFADGHVRRTKHFDPATMTTRYDGPAPERPEWP